MRRYLLLAAIALAMFTGSAAAQGPYDYGQGLWAWTYASAYGRLPYRTGNLPTPPYFALHPPVYYSSQIYRRPYGDSPFAYGPQRPVQVIVVQAAGTRAEPKWIDNPYVEAPAAAAPSAARMIRNPYYQPVSAELAH